jgi:hypothetical protein
MDKMDDYEIEETEMEEIEASLINGQFSQFRLQVRDYGQAEFIDMFIDHLYDMGESDSTILEKVQRVAKILT